MKPKVSAAFLYPGFPQKQVLYQSRKSDATAQFLKRALFPWNDIIFGGIIHFSHSWTHEFQPCLLFQPVE